MSRGRGCSIWGAAKASCSRGCAINKNVDGRGVELTGASVQKAIARGVSVYQGDLESGLDDYPEQAFDYVILSQTLQQTRDPLKVLKGMLRIGQARHRRVPEFRALAGAGVAPVDGPLAADGAVSLRLVRFAEYPFSDGARF